MTKALNEMTREELIAYRAEINAAALALWKTYKGVSKETILAEAQRQHRVSSMSMKSPREELIGAIVDAHYGGKFHAIDKHLARRTEAARRERMSMV